MAAINWKEEWLKRSARDFSEFAHEHGGRIIRDVVSEGHCIDCGAKVGVDEVSVKVGFEEIHLGRERDQCC